ncbi:MAG TPA: PDZ domain-containing protein [Thermoanaerobaculia bacterium]
MKLRFLVSLALLSSLVAAVVVRAEDEGHCNASARECTQQIRHMLGGRRYLGVQVVELKPGLVIKTVLPDSPASRVALKAGDRLIAVNGKSLSQANASNFKQYLAEAKETGKILLIVQRRGAYRRIEVRLEPYPEEYIEKVITGHLSQSHTATAGAQP